MEGFRLVKKETNPILRGEVEENTTFYYSNFKLFNEYSELMFSKYMTFKKDLHTFLGEEWHNYAQKTIFKNQDDIITFLTSQQVFNAAFETWLEIRKDAKLETDPQSHLLMPPPTQKNLILSSEANSDNPEEEKKSEKSEKSESVGFKAFVGHRSEDDQTLETFMLKIRERFVSFEINEMLFKVIIQAFNVSATKVWKEISGGYFGDSSTKAGGFINESKKFLLNKLQTFYNSKSKVLKPILVATERIREYVIDSSRSKQPLQFQMSEEKDSAGPSSLSSNLPSEAASTLSNDSSMIDDEHELKKNFKHLKISANDNTNPGSMLGKRSSMQANTVVEIKKINKKLEKMLNPHTIEFAAYYVNNMVKTSTNDWQVSRNFVTNMVEVNYNKLLKLENQISNKSHEIGNDVRIRFIQPAQDFYNCLMEIWIIFKTQALDREILFPEYLNKVKTNLGDLWNEKFMAAVQNFFMTLYYEWSHLKHVEVDTEQKILHFTKKVKESMLKVWEESIVKKAEELSSKTGNQQH